MRKLHVHAADVRVDGFALCAVTRRVAKGRLPDVPFASIRPAAPEMARPARGERETQQTAADAALLESRVREHIRFGVQQG